jgi:hypothetical protein
MRSVTSSAYPSEVVVFDTETTEKLRPDGLKEHVLEFGWAVSTRWREGSGWQENKWFRFDNALAFLTYLEDLARPKQRLYVYCHNANFDWQVVRLTTLLPSLGWKCTQALFEDPPNQFKFTKDRKTLVFSDTTNYWKQSVKKIGERIGIAKLSLPESWSNTAIGDAYCRRDCEIVLSALQTWIAWLRSNDLGGLALSLAGQAWSAYKHRFMDHPIYIDDNVAALELARDSYVGGRVEARVVGRELSDITVLDINSMYPHVMRRESYPTRLHGIYKRVSLSELERWSQKYAVVCHVRLGTEIPAYPVRQPHGLTFPVGNFDAYLTTAELRYALSHEHVTHCYAAAIYDKAPIFSRFIDEMYAIRLGYRQIGDETGSHNTKILMNSLYGKFGQRSGHEEIIGEDPLHQLKVITELDLVTGKRYRVRYIAGLILSRSLDSESRESHPAIASHVAGYARALLWRYVEQAGPSNVFYMDTDSLHVNATGLSALAGAIDASQLGALKKEKHISRATYFGPKDYVLDGVRTLKGVRPNAEVIGIGQFRQEQWLSLKGSAMLGHVGGPLVRTVEKTYRRVYRKGSVDDTGLVSPFRLGEGDGLPREHGHGLI